MSSYEPELGQMAFGNKWEEYDVPNEVGEMLYDLADKLLDTINDSPSYGVEYSNDVFEMHPYYWGDCTCGFDEEEEEWLETHDHKKDCFHLKYLKYEAELEAKGISLFNEKSEEWKRLMDKFAKENGYTGWEGIASYCDCGFKEEYARWRETHDHKPDCPIVLPNFRYKPTGLAIYWYKYIGRGMSANQKINLAEFRRIIKHCEESAQKDIEEARRKKEEEKRRVRKWKQERRRQGFLCQDCFHFWGETKDGRVICFAEPNEDEVANENGFEVVKVEPNYHGYKKECPYFFKIK